MPPALEARGVGKRYGKTHVLTNVSFRLDPGSLTAITGRSGSGKSTLFKLLAGLDRPDEGEVLVDDLPIQALDDDALSQIRRKQISLVFQAYNLLPDLTALENVRLPLDIAGLPRRVANARADELLKLVGLDHARDQLPNTLSGGEAQRVAIARAIATRPKVILADEPTGSLDAENAENVVSLLETINRETRTTIVVITHDQLVIERGWDRLHLHDGSITASGAR